MKHPRDKSLSEIMPKIDFNNVTKLDAGSESIKIEIEKLSEVKEEKVRWLWEDRLAFGKMTLIAGEPGAGKSQMSLESASVVSNGGKFHFESKPCEAENVLLICGEDKSSDTVKPRLMALGANLEKIDCVKGIQKVDKSGNKYFDPICLVEHITEFENLIIKNKYKLIIVDPISLYLGSVDENKNKEIRSALAILNAVAERHDFSLILISHFSKPGAAQKSAINRIMGSIGFVAAARVVYCVMKDPEDTTKRLFIPIKNNLGKDDEGFSYNIKPIIVGDNIRTSRIEWTNEKISKSANELMNTTFEKQSPRLDEAKELLKDILKFGSASLSEIRSKIQSKGISIDRMYEAKNALNILETDSLERKRGKIWSLP